MLSFFRSGGAGQSIVGVVVVAVIVVFVLEFRNTGRGCGPAKASCAVEVCGECVQYKEFSTAQRLVISGRLPEGQEIEGRKVTLAGLVERELLAKEATRLGIGVTDDAVDEEIKAGRAYMSVPVDSDSPIAQILAGRAVTPLLEEKERGENFDYAAYERRLKNLGRSSKEFKRMQRRELLAARVRELIRARTQVLPDEMFAQFQKYRAKASLKVARADWRWFARNGAVPTDTGLETWIQNRKTDIDKKWEDEKSGWEAGCLVVREIRIGGQDEARARGILEQAQKRAAKEDFEALAREFSEADEAAVGGALGCLSEARYGSGAATLITAAGKLAPGKLSDILQSERGFHLLQLVKKLDAKEIEAEGKRHVSRTIGMQAEAEEQARLFSQDVVVKATGAGAIDTVVADLSRAWLEKAHPSWKDQPAATRALAAEDRPRVETTKPFGLSETPVVGTIEDVASLAFKLAKVGSFHDLPIRTLDGWVAIQLTERKEPTREEFDKSEEKDRLLDQERHFKAEDQLRRYVARLRAQSASCIKVDPELTKAAKGDG